jgi:hypothetical protein
MFALHSMRTRFHLDCLFVAMRLRKRLYPEVLAQFIDGLRSAVDAYAWARQALDLRMASANQAAEPVEWDEEDASLLSEANADYLAEPA